MEKLLPLADQVIGNPVNPNAANMLLKAGAQFFIEQTDKPPVRQ